MNIVSEQTALMVYLNTLNKAYYGKVLELRDAIQGWLAYIPETFPHYTRHTLQHSDEIVIQISKLLFTNEREEQPVIRLSAAEIYILIASAYLHDSGMVAADQEKLGIITSDAEWQSWVTGEGGGAKRWSEIENLRKSPSDVFDPAKQFIADLQTRFLLAEFIRRRHHLRAADVIQQYQGHLGRFAFDDPIMQRTISDVCVAHGLMSHELEDSERYPMRRDIQGGSVNVRLLAILLRLGDLLDMTYDRACPLLMNAANPLPPESLAHWTQYQRLKHRATSPQRIEMIAECDTQEEHRVLQDWCQWIVDEVRQAKILMNRSELHHEWQPPIAQLEGPDASIKIRPARGATYIPSNWKFDLDQAAVTQLLIGDLYESPFSCIRELIQNALDATRCRMYEDLQLDGKIPPEFPTQVDENVRRRYPINIKLEVRQIINNLSGESEDRQVLIIEDQGLGMDREIIQRYFLQIGRSYYRTEEFRRNYRFIPTSRFGVGFLSVFAVTDHIVVDTLKQLHTKLSEPIRITLLGPRNYLLTEQGTRRASGTRIEVSLREPIVNAQLTRIVSEWCRRVEFPIVIDDLGVVSTITAESQDQFSGESQDVTVENARFVIQQFPINRHGIEGEIYIFARTDEQGERWDWRSYERSNYLETYPQASLPTLPTNLTCLHGIVVSDKREMVYAPHDQNYSVRADFRSKQYVPTLSRTASRTPRAGYPVEVTQRCEELLMQHLASSPLAIAEEGWKYKQRLVETFPLYNFWRSLDGMIPIYNNGERLIVSLEAASSLPKITSVLEVRRATPTRPAAKTSKNFSPIKHGIDSPTFLLNDIRYCSDWHRSVLFENRKAVKVRWLDNYYLAIDWILLVGQMAGRVGGTQRSATHVELPDPEVVAITVPTVTYGGELLLNANHCFVEWLKGLPQAIETNPCQITGKNVERIIELLYLCAEYNLGASYTDKLNKYLAEWRRIPGLSSGLIPPPIDFSSKFFILRPPATGR